MEDNCVPTVSREIVIEKLTYGGDGLGRLDGKACFVPFTLPGEKLRIGVTEEKRGYCRGRIEEIIQASPQRRDPPCPYYGECGGCSWQHMEYAAQLQAKQEILQELLSRIDSAVIEQIAPSPTEFRYRAAARMKSEAGVGIGFYAGKSRRLVPIDSCLLLEEGLNQTLSSLAERFKTAPEAGDSGGIDLLRRGEGETAIFRRAEGEQAPFNQVNPAVNELIRERITTWSAQLPERSQILDLFCGNGNLSIPLLARGFAVNGYDTEAAAVKEAAARSESAVRSESAALSEAEPGRGRFRRLDLYRNVEQTAGGSRAYSGLILDPPRRGLKGIAGKIAAWGIPKIVYISCDPPAMVRDLQVFLNSGYTLRRVEPFDMFPQTYHMEVLAFLEKENDLQESQP